VRALLRLGAACAIAGSILAILVGILHPRPSKLDDHEAFLRVAAESPTRWLLVHLGLVLASILLLAGLGALSAALWHGSAAALARVGLVGAAVGTAVRLAQESIDLALGEVAEDWANATGADKEAALRAGAALEDVDFAMLSVHTLVFFGLTYAVYGLAVRSGERFPSRLGWIAVAGGVAAATVGLVQLVTGPSFVTAYVFPAIAALLSLWLIAIGVLLWRQTTQL
jgi:drug/metabolite transporter (DMT)-like permease